MSIHSINALFSVILATFVGALVSSTSDNFVYGVSTTLMIFGLMTWLLDAASKKKTSYDLPETDE